MHVHIYATQIYIYNGFRVYRRSFFEAFFYRKLHKLSCFLSFKYEEAAVREHFLDLKLRKQNAVACLKRMRAVQFDRIQSTPLGIQIHMTTLV